MMDFGKLSEAMTAGNALGRSLTTALNAAMHGHEDMAATFEDYAVRDLHKVAEAMGYSLVKGPLLPVLPFGMTMPVVAA